ncbi:MAG: ABC transporter ATP-binding protein, partial [Burkholderiaceae bacterium]|nr:ABC transporter ATP-binding protein [Burkholderiaceae bacterium]
MKHRAKTMLDDTVLQIEALCFAYPECAVLSQWSAALPAGVSLLRGEESSGKTTLLRLLAGELVAQSGRMGFGGGALGGGPSPGVVFWADPRSVTADERTALAWLDGLP